MKLEKLNDNQIRCTLNKSDLDKRELRLSELAYGSAKARALFRDMIQQASIELGFEADNIPLMIEAIPVSNDCLVLVVTKVEDPEELDTRFSKFAPSVHDDDSLDDMIQDLNEGADDVLDLFRRIHEGRTSSQGTDREAAQKAASDKKEEEELQITRIYSFDSLNHITRLAHVLEGFYNGVNSLYKDAGKGRYLLIVSNSSHTPEEFNKLCNCLSEYGRQEKSAPGGGAFLEEHCELIVKDHALQAFGRI